MRRVAVTPNGRYLLACGDDRYFRVRDLATLNEPSVDAQIAPLFVDESPLIDFEPTHDGKYVVVLCQSGALRLIRTADWTLSGSLPSVEVGASDIAVDLDGTSICVATVTGDLLDQPLQPTTATLAGEATAPPVYVELGPLEPVDEEQLAAIANPPPAALKVPRGVKITGRLATPGEADTYQWVARQGEVWAIDGDAVNADAMDPFVQILTPSLQPLVRQQLQAVRETYFTFRGKNSHQSDDFRLFNWRELPLDAYLYANGEVCRLWMHPRGPDSGFNVYPGQGDRWTYFGTTALSHALGEPAYIVRALRSRRDATFERSTDVRCLLRERRRPVATVWQEQPPALSVRSRWNLLPAHQRRSSRWRNRLCVSTRNPPCGPLFFPCSISRTTDDSQRNRPRIYCERRPPRWIRGTGYLRRRSSTGRRGHQPAAYRRGRTIVSRRYYLDRRRDEHRANCADVPRGPARKLATGWWNVACKWAPGSRSSKRHRPLLPSSRRKDGPTKMGGGR